MGPGSSCGCAVRGGWEPREPPYPVVRASDPGEGPGLKVPVAAALGMSLRSSRTHVATSMFICLARWNAFPETRPGVSLPGTFPAASPAPGQPHLAAWRISSSAAGAAGSSQ